MRPAFSSTRQAAAFAVLLLLVLLSPVLVARRFLPPRSEIYSSIWWASGSFPFIYHQLYEEKGQIDIAFLGASRVNYGIDPAMIQKALAARLGRPAVARTLGWGGAGEDALYFITHDLLENRKVRMLVIDDIFNHQDVQHPLAPKLFRFEDDRNVLPGLSLSAKAACYFASIAGVPRNLLNDLRPNILVGAGDGKTWQQIHLSTPNVFDRLGAICSRMGFSPNIMADSQCPREEFADFTPTNSATPADVCVWPIGNRASFDFSSAPIPPAQLHFLRLVVELAKTHDCKLVLLHFPLYDERAAAGIVLSPSWQEALAPGSAILGVPGAAFFKNLSDLECRRLYANPTHLNENGQRYFTALIAPQLAQIYASQIDH